jgi:hypothetical protein
MVRLFQKKHREASSSEAAGEREGYRQRIRELEAEAKLNKTLGQTALEELSSVHTVEVQTLKRRVAELDAEKEQIKRLFEQRLADEKGARCVAHTSRPWSFAPPLPPLRHRDCVHLPGSHRHVELGIQLSSHHTREGDGRVAPFETGASPSVELLVPAPVYTPSTRRFRPLSVCMQVTAHISAHSFAQVSAHVVPCAWLAGMARCRSVTGGG